MLKICSYYFYFELDQTSLRLVRFEDGKIDKPHSADIFFIFLSAILAISTTQVINEMKIYSRE